MIISHMNAVKKSKEKTADQSTRFIEAAKKAEKPGKKPAA
jgi:hypothetical protein